MQRITITKADDGVRLDRWFKRHYPNVSHGMLQKAIRKKAIKLDGKRVETSERVAAGQELKFPEFKQEAAPKRPQAELTAKEITETQSWVIMKTDDIVAINKPAGMAVQGGSGLKDHLDRRLDALCFDGQDRPKLVHRLDKDTSGVMLLARSANAAWKLQEYFRDKKAQKIYWALVSGVPEIREGEIEGALQKGGDEGMERMMVVDEDDIPEYVPPSFSGFDTPKVPEPIKVKEAKTPQHKVKGAVTLYRTLEALGTRLAVMELEPVTGRTHQLRVHMNQMGHPIIGDGKYGGKAAFVDGGMELSKKLHLHARRIVIEPLGIDISAPLPPHMQESWEKLDVDDH